MGTSPSMAPTALRRAHMTMRTAPHRAKAHRAQRQAHHPNEPTAPEGRADDFAGEEPVPPLTFYYAQPEVGGAGVMEPLAPTTSGEDRTHLINVDLKFENTSPEPVALQSFSVSYGGPGAPSSRSFFGPDLAPPTDGKDDYLWGGGWHTVGAYWESEEDDGEGYWRDAAMNGKTLLSAGVSFGGRWGEPSVFPRA